MSQAIDFSHEILITRHLNGVKFVRPEQAEIYNADRELLTLGELAGMPYNVFFYDPDYYVLETNETCAVNCGFDSRVDALGVNVREMCENPDEGLHVIDNNNRALHGEELVIADEQLNLWNSKFTHTISFKFPWYGNDDAVIGVFGCAVMVNERDAKDINDKLGLVTRQFISKPVVKNISPARLQHDGKYFSRREMDVIKYVMRGKTMREIGVILGLSRRTIESYFEKIKMKANVKTRSELFDKLAAF